MEILNHPLFSLSIVLCIFAEYRVSVRLELDNYNPWEAYTSLVILFLDRVIAYFTERDASGPATWLWNHRIMDLSCGGNLLITLIAVEFAYYWAHRYNHSTRLGWASHSIHHTPTRYNLTMGYRLGLTRVFSLAWMMFLPLMLLGFRPRDVALIGGVTFVYQFFLHTEGFVPKLGFLESFLNTPSNHRVHHGDDPRYYDKNLGGLTLIFDRVFGTYMPEPERGKMSYGIPGVVARRSLAHEIFGQWAALVTQLRLGRGPVQWLTTLFGTSEKPDSVTRSFRFGGVMPVIDWQLIRRRFR